MPHAFPRDTLSVYLMVLPLAVIPPLAPSYSCCKIQFLDSMEKIVAKLWAPQQSLPRLLSTRQCGVPTSLCIQGTRSHIEICGSVATY